MPQSKRKQGPSRRRTAIDSWRIPNIAELLEGLPIGTLILNPDLTILTVNREGRRFLGPRSRLPMKQSFPAFWSTLTASDADLITTQLTRVLRSGRPIASRQQLHMKRTGTLVPVEWTCTPNMFGDATVLIICIRDLSQEMEVKHERDRLAAIAHESPSPMIELDRHGSLLYANPAMISLLSRFGYSLEGFPSVAPAQLMTIIQRCLSTGQILHGEDVLLPKASFSWTFCPVLPH
jgi:two-component system, sensor histidine kinase and response regulator